MIDVVALALCAILHIESSNGINLKTGDGGRAVGPYQMWTVAVDEANRIEKLYARKYGRRARRWTYNDRRCFNASRDMCELTLVWHYRRGVRDPVELVCKWNMPYGKCDRAYRNKSRKAVGYAKNKTMEKYER